MSKIFGFLFWGMVMVVGIGFLAAAVFPFVYGIYQQVPYVLEKAMR